MLVLETIGHIENSEFHRDNVEGQRLHQQCFVLHQFINDVLGYFLEGRFGRDEQSKLTAS